MVNLEPELIRSLKQGDQKAFERVFRSYFSKLCAFAYSYTKQLESAEDLVKDVFVNLWNNRENLTIKSSLSGYLFRSVRNSCINYLERDKYHKNLHSEEIKQLDIKIIEPLSENYPVANIFVKELEIQIYSEIEKLPDSCKQIFKLSRFEGLSHKTIAKKLNISENTVKVQIYRALKKVKEALSSDILTLFLFSLKK